MWGRLFRGRRLFKLIYYCSSLELPDAFSGHDAHFHNGYVWVTFEANHAILGFPVAGVRELRVVE